MDYILQVKKISKAYHTEKDEILAIKDFSLNLSKGEFIGIVGPSGCGKSTILSILCGLEEKSSGDIIFKDNSLNIGYMLQQDCLFEWRNVLNNCLLGLEINNTLKKDKKNNVIRLLKTYGLEEFIYNYPNSLSGGMRQRVALIRTLANNPDILLLDEPFSALDYQSRLNIADDIYTILKKEKKTAILVTHDIAEAISMCDKVIVLSKRPCSIKNIYKIDLKNRSTPRNNRKDEKFNYYYNSIWKDIDMNV